MGVRQRLPLPFGEGIDRASGAAVTDPTVFNDIRNVHLTRGRAELRKGNARGVLFPAPWTHLLGVYLIRAQGLAGAVVYDSVSRKVGLFVVDGTGTGIAYVDDLWTLPAGATSPPRISATDSYDQLIIAHDEPVYPSRQATMVYSAVSGTLGPLELDLARLGTTEPVKFRGVQKWLAYIVGWGYGTNAADQGDRGEVLRISMPGEPTNFVPEHYFLVGTQGDPIIGCGPCAGRLAVLKIASMKYLVGADRTSFAIQDGDPAYGLQSSRLHVSVNEEFHFWSLSGPRVATGGASADLGLPLELAGVAPDALATATAAEMGFAYYDPTEREVVYVFGQWAYVLHKKDGNPRWSYRPFAVPMVNAGQLYVGGNQELGNITAHPEPAFPTYIEPTYAPGDGSPKHTIDWTNVGGAGVTTETLEIWVRQFVTGAPWKKKWSGPATALTATITQDSFLTPYDFALRYTMGGFPAPGYASANPYNWPGVSRQSGSTGGSPTEFFLGKWQRFDSTHQGYDVVSFPAPGLNLGPGVAEPLYDIEVSSNGGSSYAPFVTGVPRDVAMLSIVFANSDSLGERIIRIRGSGPVWQGGSIQSHSAWFSETKIIAPEPPDTFTLGGIVWDGANNHDDTHAYSWTAPAAVHGEVPAPGPYEVWIRHFDNYSSPPPNFGAYTIETHVAGTTADASHVGLGFSSSALPDRTADVRIRTYIGSDVSPWVLRTLFES